MFDAPISYDYLAPVKRGFKQICNNTFASLFVLLTYITPPTARILTLLANPAGLESSPS